MFTWRTDTSCSIKSKDGNIIRCEATNICGTVDYKPLVKIPNLIPNVNNCFKVKIKDNSQRDSEFSKPVCINGMFLNFVSDLIFL